MTKADSFESPVSSDKVLEAPGRFKSRDMLARTPVAHAGTNQSLDSSLPPPPPSDMIPVTDHNDNDDCVITPDFPPPPPVDNIEMIEDNPASEVTETPDIR